jgi:hypothetical protein
MELSGLLSNPQFAEKLEKLQSSLVRLTDGCQNTPRSTPNAQEPSLPRGLILRTIVEVLAAEAGGLRTVEIRRRVEERLGRELPRSIVKAALAEHARPSGLFKRVRPGVYVAATDDRRQ